MVCRLVEVWYIVGSWWFVIGCRGLMVLLLVVNFCLLFVEVSCSWFVCWLFVYGL